VSSFFTYKIMSFMFAAEIMHYCSMDLLSANYCHCVLSCKAALCRLIEVSVVLTATESVSRMRLKYA
jgi:hypothetical protein